MAVEPTDAAEAYAAGPEATDADEATPFHEVEPAGEAPFPASDELPENPLPETIEEDDRPAGDDQPIAEFVSPPPPARPPEPRGSRPPPPPPAPAPASSAIGEAIEDVYRITESLKKVMEELDELLETLELVERQKIEDERELDQLRRALRQIQRPREGQGQSPPPRPQRSHSR
ncbi:MAG TPA: hypothetical protein VFV96_00695 [Verrucomicrobiae bacterium]|nr:hypothetical protein [Verrucomicrobiae bacterium]